MHNFGQFKKKNLVGVIGGTRFDSKLGLQFLKSKEMDAISLNISDNPFDQTLSQLSPGQLTVQVKDKINSLLLRGCNSIFVYCNSLSVAIDIRYLRKHFTVPLLTPVETYDQVSNRNDSIAVMAANCQSLGNIEKIILEKNPYAVITGFSSLLIVDAVEKGLDAVEIIEKFELVFLSRMLEKNKIPLMILGCTHFSYFYKELQKLLRDEKIGIEIFDPSETMYKNLMSFQKGLVKSLNF